MAAGVDDAGLAQHLELLRGPRDRALAVLDRPLQDLGQDRVLLGVADVAAEPLLVGLEVGELAGERVGHLAEDGQHRPLGRLAHRVVGGVGGAGEGGGDQDRVDQLAGAAGELLGGAADDLAEDHAGVAAGPHQRRPGQRLDQLGAADLVDLEPVEAVELLHHGPHRHRHVVARVAVGDREDVEVVDLLASGLERGVGGADDPSEAGDRGIGHLAGESNRRRRCCGAAAIGVATVPRSMRRFATWITGPPQDGDHQLDRRPDRGRESLAGSAGSDFSEEFKLPASDSTGSLRPARKQVPGPVRRQRADRLQGQGRGRSAGR